MRAKLVVAMMGTPNRNPGFILEGDEALRCVKAGYAVPLREEPVIETADAPKHEQAVRKPRSKKA